MLVRRPWIFENVANVDDIGRGAGFWEKIIDNTTGNLNDIGEHL